MPARAPTEFGVKTIVLIVFDECQLLDVTGPTEVFAQANLRSQRPHPTYRLVHASPGGGLVRSSAGLNLASTLSLDEVGDEIDTIMMVGGPRLDLERLISTTDVVQWIRSRVSRTRRIASVCTGAFALAAAGLLDGRRATTHWESADRLQRCYPNVRVDADPIYISDPPIHTSAGVSAGIDLALSFVEADLGAKVALDVARELVLFLRRPGTQTQFSVGLRAQARATGRIGKLVDWIVANPAEDLTVPALASRAGMSERNFSRVFVAEIGITPARLVETIRVERAKTFLEDGTIDLARVVGLVGFGSIDSLQRAFRLHVGVTPSAYRERFKTS